VKPIYNKQVSEELGIHDVKKDAFLGHPELVSGSKETNCALNFLRS
jgi:hypothetical protein